MDLQTLSPQYLSELARQLAFLSAFLGGFSATFLATLVVAKLEHRWAGWAIGVLAVSASSFVIAVVSAVMVVIVLHPDVPRNIASGHSIALARVFMLLGFVLGIYGLLAGMGLSGWLRSRNTGIATSVAALWGLVVVSWAIAGFGG